MMNGLCHNFCGDAIQRFVGTGNGAAGSPETPGCLPVMYEKNCQRIVRNSTMILQRPGQGEHLYPLGAGLAEKLRALVHGRAGRQDIVNQQDIFALDVFRVSEGKCPGKVPAPFCSV
jgi:hypothetical protein